MTNAALYFAAAAFAIILIGMSVLGHDAFRIWWALLIGAPAGAAAATLIVWRFLKGAWAGAAIGVLTHPFAWYAALVVYWITGTAPTDAFNVNPIDAFAASRMFAGWTWLMTGWYTIPVAALLGWWIARLR